MIVTAHQLNFLPGVSVISKIAAADVVIWEDELEFTRGYEHRNRFPNGKWMTVPVEYGSVGEPLNRVRIAARADDGRGWRAPMAAAIRKAWPFAAGDAIADELLRPHRQLLGLNLALMEILVRSLGIATRQRFQSMLEGGHEWPGTQFNAERLAEMVVEVGGTVYLSGPSGRKKYLLDEAPFLDRGVEVRYWDWEPGQPNPCALELARDREQVAA
jgi:hypothetical protein